MHKTHNKVLLVPRKYSCGAITHLGKEARQQKEWRSVGQNLNKKGGGGKQYRGVFIENGERNPHQLWFRHILRFFSGQKLDKTDIIGQKFIEVVDVF